MKKYISLILFLFSWITYSQNSLNFRDSILLLDFDQLYDKFIEESDANKSLEIAKIYLLKAKQKKDTLQQINAYNFLSISQTNYLKEIAYLDSIILIAKSEEHKKRYKAFTLYRKGETYFHNNKYKKALDYSLEADKNFIEDSNHKFYSKLLVAIIRHKIGDYQKSIPIYHSIKNYFKNSKDDYYETAIFGLSEAYLGLKNLDSAKYYIKLGHEISLKSQTGNLPYFTYCYGELAYHQGDFQNALDSLRKSRSIFIRNEDFPNLAQTEYWLGATSKELGDTANAILHYRRLDSIFDITANIPPILRNGWEILIQDAKNKQNVNNELYYTRRLKKLDSILNEDYKYLSKNFTNKFDIPNIISKNKKEIITLESKQKKAYIIVSISIVILILVLLYLIWYKKQKIKKEHNYLKIIEQLKNPSKIKPKGNSNRLKISDEHLKRIQEGISDFEEKNLFLTKGMTSTIMANEWNTNKRYISLYINHIVDSNVPNYINTLRIKYAIKRFTSNEGNFRYWRMNAIAEELGFGSREYYVKAFKEYTGMKPNEYLERLEIDIKKQRNS